MLGRRVEPLSPESERELAQEEGVATRGLVAGGAEARLRRRGEGRLDQPRGSEQRERARPHDDPAGVGQDGVEEPLVGAGLVRPHARQQDDRQALQPAADVQERAQRRGVGPVQVVDGEEQRPPPCQVRREPLADPRQALRIGSGELTRGRDKLAMLRGDMVRASGNSIQLYSVSDLSSAPRAWPCAVQGATGGEFGKPTWAPSGAALTWAEADGIWTSPVGGDCASLAPRLTIPGGGQPDWGPADPGAPVAAPAATPPPSAQGARTAPRLRVAAPRSIRRGALLRRGLRVTVTCTQRCNVSATLSYKHRRIAARTGRRAKPGALTLRVRATRRGLARLPRRGAVRLTVTATTPGAPRQVIARTVKVRR